MIESILIRIENFNLKIKECIKGGNPTEFWININI